MDLSADIKVHATNFDKYYAFSTFLIYTFLKLSLSRT